ncbi:MAG TPA: nitronate monooxygenase [Candidatus Rifleibacterium sp.]|nr:nitronate monooxygenase [Candidatus Rifleibacterium sp.]HPT45217.1 nitronate monooxygenase [Candidatus Rifleibacterium sp.]
MPRLIIGNLHPKYPLMQGGMAIRVSTGKLAGAVAREGGIGLIAASGMEVEEVLGEIKIARSIANGGIVGINTMVAASCFPRVMRAAAEAGIDALIAGAGFSRDIFDIGRDHGIPVVPIVSSDRVAVLAEKLGASAVVVEGCEAGGHLGTERPARSIFPEVKAAVNIPVLLAGGIIDRQDIIDAFEFGADGVQVGTRFAASFEANVAKAFHDTYLKAKKGDVFRIKSPVGLWGNALPTPYTDKLAAGTASPRVCGGCLKKCSHSFCIIQALIEARAGNLEEGLVFSGEQVYRIDKIMSVAEIFAMFFQGLENRD